MINKDNVLTYATAFATVSFGALMISFIPGALGMRQVQKAQAFNLMADGHRMISLAKTYDAKAAAQSIKTVAEKIL